MPLVQGQVLIARYRIAKLVGQGGYGAVYRAWDLRLNRPCALKENLDGSDEAQRQFGREAEVLAKIQYPNLPRVMDHFSIPGEGQFLVMDFIEGENLQRMIEDAGALPEAQVLGWIRQICDALIYLHTQSPPLIHRDIKPANIKITPEGRAVLVDFGIVKIYDPVLRTTIGARAVTPGYSPVEQYGQGATDARTDVYALGATLYTLLMGQEPPESILRLTGTPIPEISSNVNEKTKRAILMAMAVMPDDRHQSISEFRSTLSAATPVTVKTEQTAPDSKPSIGYVRPNLAGIEWIEIPSGAFLYGQKKRKVNIEKPYRIGKYPVTNAQYKRFLDANSDHRVPPFWDWLKTFPFGKDLHPVVNVSCRDAEAFCKWAGCRLPTEVEWEKTARGINGRSYPWGETWLENRCNLESETTPVDRFPEGASPYGAYDMSGNVYEWTQDPVNYVHLKNAFINSLRGGGTSRDSARVDKCNLLNVPFARDYKLNRLGIPTTYSNKDIGFRCAQDI